MNSIQQYLSSDESAVEDKSCTSNGRKRSLSSSLGGVTLLQSPDEIDKSNNVFKRSRPHVQGNWAGTLFISLIEQGQVGPSSQLREFASRKVKQFYHNLVDKQQESSNKADIIIVPLMNLNDLQSDSDASSSGSGSESESGSDTEQDKNTNDLGLHISLAKPFFLQKQSIQPFVTDLKRRMSVIHPFTVQFETNSEDIEILVNDCNTRSFLTLPVSNNIEALKDLVTAIDTILIKYGLETYYSNPKFHCSIASWKGNFKWVNDSLSMLNRRVRSTSLVTDEKQDISSTSNGKQITFIVRGVQCNFGITERHLLLFKT